MAEAGNTTDAPQAVASRLSVFGLSKHFGSTRALNGVAMEISGGEIRGFVGCNGSGKSTLVKILSGFHRPDPGGSVALDGVPVGLPLDGEQARSLGLCFVHQDLGLIDDLSVLENVRVGRYAGGAFGRIDWSRQRSAVANALDAFDVDVHPDTKVRALGQIDRTLVAIVRSFLDLERFGPGVLVLDEPTASLPRDSVDLLFAAVRRVAEAGTAVLFISHRLDEVISLADSVSVLRDGALLETVPSSVPESELIAMMLGRSLQAFYPDAGCPSGRTVLLDTQGLSGEIVSGVDMQLHEGEILGITGINGSGYAEIPHLVFGATRARGGAVRIGGTTHGASELTPAHAINAGVALLPADRQRASGAQDFTLAENLSLPDLSRFTSHGRIVHRHEHTVVGELLREHGVTPSDPGARLGELSGGNQQKALLAKWLCVEPKILLLDEPGQGVDVGAKAEIFSRIVEAANRGAGVLIASAEYDDLAHLCDRVIVLREGRIRAELRGAQLTEERIVEQSYLSDGS